MAASDSAHNMDELYRNLLPNLKILEEERIELSKKLDKLKKFSILGTAVVVVISFPWLGIMSPVFFGAMGIGFYAVLYHRMKKNYRQGYKDKIFKELVHELGRQYSYQLEGQIADNALSSSGLFHDYNQKQCEDQISGKFDDHSFELAELSLFKETEGKGADSGGALHVIFKGLIFIGTISTNFPTGIWILSKNHPQTHGQDRIQAHWQKVELKHLAFRKEYQIFAEDKEIAYQILQDNILDTIMETKDQVVDEKMRLELSFQNNIVYLSISTLKELFEPPINTPVTDLENFKANFKYLVSTTSLLKKLTLAK